MKLAIAIFRYFPYGGLQRDMKFIAEEAIKRGHQVTIFCGNWQGEKIAGADIRVIDTFVFFNIAGVRRFVKAFEKEFNRQEFDLLLGFNKMPGLDVYFAGDTCFAEKAYKKRSWLYRLAPRTRLYLAYEKAVFDNNSSTLILSLVNSEQKKFKSFYATQDDRFLLLPPGIVPGHIACSNSATARQSLLARLNLAANTRIILCVGSYFYRKGVDISIDVIAHIQRDFPDVVLIVVGDDNPDVYRQQAFNLGIADKVFFIGPCDHMGDLFHAADIFLHLAREELAGNVILEAMLCNCPVLVSSVCGYADYVSRYDMGKVTSSLMNTEKVAQELIELLNVDKSHWSEKSKYFYEQGDAFSRIPVILDFFESKLNSNAQQSISNKNSCWALLPNLWGDEKLINQLKAASDKDELFEFIGQMQGISVRKMSDRETIRFVIGDKTYYLKKHFGVGYWEVVKNLLQLRLPVLGASNEWKSLQKLSAFNVPSLQAVAYGVKGKNPAHQQSFIITRELSDVVQLDHFLESNSLGVQQKIYLIKKVADIARDMHAAGINHRDLYLCHFMLKQEWSNSSEPDISIIDLHRAQIRLQVPERWLVKDLAALYFSSMSLPVSSKDRLRFLKFYYQKSLSEILNQEKKLLSKIEARAKRLYHKHE